MFEFIKNIINKVFSKKQKLLENIVGEEFKSADKNKASIDEIGNVYEYLTEIKESCDNYKEYVYIMKKYEQVRQDLSDLKEEISKLEELI